jgi:hypothetical protein
MGMVRSLNVLVINFSLTMENGKSILFGFFFFKYFFCRDIGDLMVPASDVLVCIWCRIRLYNFATMNPSTSGVTLLLYP